MIGNIHNEIGGHDGRGGKKKSGSNAETKSFHGDPRISVKHR
jgi:hypothetical protein